MITYNELENKLASMSNSDLERLAIGAGVPFNTLLKLKNGQTKNPRIRTVESLINYLARSGM